MALGLLSLREEPGGLDHDIHPHLFPRQVSRRFRADDFDLRAVDHKHVVFSLVHRGFLRADRAAEAALC